MTNNPPLANALTIESPIAQAMNETFDALHAFRSAQMDPTAPDIALAMLHHDLVIADRRRKTLSRAKMNFALN